MAAQLRMPVVSSTDDSIRSLVISRSHLAGRGHQIGQTKTPLLESASSQQHGQPAMGMMAWQNSQDNIAFISFGA
jgi:hypothetical protein